MEMENMDAQSEEMTTQQGADFETAFDEEKDVPDGQSEPEDDEFVKELFADEPQTGGQTGEEPENAWEEGEPAPQEEQPMTEEQRAQAYLAEQQRQAEEEARRSVEQAVYESKTNARAEQLIGQGYEPGMAWHIAQIEMENARFRDPEGAVVLERQRQQDAMKADAQSFFEMFPHVQEIPLEVLEDMEKSGSSGIVAYQRYLIREKERELAQLRQERKNRASTPGSVRGRGTEQEDPFIAELMK